ncbi:hypothetical protein DPEC_G00064060 [Dallia pectoralis]|uniref:Uncharacterized protein n=1 Tax=Dallia pectoralis TaxID=75939 RepID=A0ACC2H8C8_DALPE|nr:hypothetical protein DPEC_G00064060 [Dallia pectoralis]
MKPSHRNATVLLHSAGEVHPHAAGQPHPHAAFINRLNSEDWRRRCAREHADTHLADARGTSEPHLISVPASEDNPVHVSALRGNSNGFTYRFNYACSLRARPVADRGNGHVRGEQSEGCNCLCGSDGWGLMKSYVPKPGRGDQPPCRPSAATAAPLLIPFLIPPCN